MSLLVLVTGHRLGPRLPRPLAARTHWRAALDRAAPDLLVTGMASGADLWAAEWAAERGVGFEAWLPFPAALQTVKWGPRERDLHAELLTRAAAVYVGDPGPYAPGKLLKRNEDMVKRAVRWTGGEAYLLPLWDGLPGSGTAHCCAYALAHGLPRLPRCDPGTGQAPDPPPLIVRRVKTLRPPPAVIPVHRYPPRCSACRRGRPCVGPAPCPPPRTP